MEIVGWAIWISSFAFFEKAMDHPQYAAVYRFIGMAIFGAWIICAKQGMW